MLCSCLPCIPFGVLIKINFKLYISSSPCSAAVVTEQRTKTKVSGALPPFCFCRFLKFLFAFFSLPLRDMEVVTRTHPSPPFVGKSWPPFAVHPSTPAESVASPPAENMASLPESLPEMTATKVPIGLLVIYERMSWPSVPAPRKCPSVPAPRQRPPEPAPHQCPPVPTSPGPVPPVPASPGPVPPLPASPGPVPPVPASPGPVPQVSALPERPQVPDRAPIFPK